MSRAVPVALIVAAATSWAAATVLTKVALRELAPLDLLAIELLSSAIAMGCLLGARGRPFLPRRWPVFALLGVLEPGLSFGLFDFGLSRTGAADGAILIASQSLFGVLLARALLGERVSAVTRAAVGVGFAGSALVGLAETGHGASLIGDLLVVAASAAAAGNGVGVRRMSAGADNLAATTTQLVAAAVSVAPVIVIAGTGGRTELASANLAHVLAAVATGVLGGAVPFLAFNRAIRDLTVAHAGLILNLIPVLAAAGAVVALGERLRWPEIAGGVLVIGAASAATALEGRSREDARPRPGSRNATCAGGSAPLTACGSV
ncbi:MAG TPA: DMT family transporter [Gaiellaceae bacterium]|nr:DMT family transporter [Gaiellaceae bacterium]